MTVLIEMQFPGWIHEDVNNGMLNLFQIVEKENILYVAEQTQIDAVQKLGITNEVEFVPIDIPDKSKAEVMDYWHEYEQILESVVERLHISKNDRIVFMSSPKCIVAAAMCVYKKIGMKITFVTHANLDYMLNMKRSEEELAAYEGIFSEFSDLRDIRFVAYNPYAAERLQGVLEDKIRNRIKFLHHPVGQTLEKKDTKDDAITIGVYGACVNANFKKMLFRLNEKQLLNKVKFLILNRSTLDGLDYRYKYPTKGIEMHQTIKGFSRDTKLQYISKMDWILLPYDKEQYRVSMSGILADAIQFQIPILALNSPIIEYYNEEHIGIVEKDIESLCNRIGELDAISKGPLYANYLDNLKRLKDRMYVENRQRVVELYNGL